MKRRSDPSDELLELVEAQDGVVTRGQVLASGLSRHSAERLVGSEWTMISRGVYYARPGEPTWRAMAWAGALYAGPGARLGFDAAGFLHGLVPREPSRISVLLPNARMIQSRQPWLFRRESPGLRGDSIGAPPRTRIDDTIIDLCGRDRRARVPHWLSKGVQTRRTTTERLLVTVNARQRVAHRAAILAILQDVALGADSPLEIDYLHNVERAHGLPIGIRQTTLKEQSALRENSDADVADVQLPSVIRRARGLAAYRRDVLYAKFDVLVELDGRLGHELDGAFRDMWRDNAHVMAGQPTLRYGWIDVAERPCAAARQVALVLVRHGWTGTLVPCPQCRA